MTSAVITWVEVEFGLLKTEVVAISPSVLAWAKSFLSSLTPVITQAATDAVLAAVTFPGTGPMKAAAALAAATADLANKGVPIAEADLKAAIQIAYNALPASVTSNVAAQAVVDAANSQINKVGTDVASDIATKAPVA